jgi:hypothetical protein
MKVITVDPAVAHSNGLGDNSIFPGLWLDPAALLRGDLAAIVAFLQQGLSSPEHAAFEMRLQGIGDKPAG